MLQDSFFNKTILKKTLCLLCFFIFIVANSHAGGVSRLYVNPNHKYYRPISEYCIIQKKDGETIEGFVKQFKWGDYIKVKSNGQKLKIERNEIKYIDFVFLGNPIDGNINIYNYNYPCVSFSDAKNGDFNKRTDEWLPLIVKGKISLFIYDTGSATFYVGKKDDQDFTVTLCKASVFAGDKKIDKELFSSFFFDYPELVQKINEMSYTSDDIIDIVNEYNAYFK